MEKSLKLGAHMSIAGGYSKALDRANSIGCTAVQLFTKNASQWAAKPIVEADTTLFTEALEKDGYQSADLVAHDSYLINLATPDDVLWEKSLTAFGIELDRCAQLGIPALGDPCGRPHGLRRRSRPGPHQRGH